MKLNEKIRTLRKERKLTQKQLSDLSGIPVNSIGKYERDERKPSYNNTAKLAKAFEISPMELTDLTGDELDFYSSLNELDTFVSLISDKDYSQKLLNALIGFLESVDKVSENSKEKSEHIISNLDKDLNLRSKIIKNGLENPSDNEGLEDDLVENAKRFFELGK